MKPKFRFLKSNQLIVLTLNQMLGGHHRYLLTAPAMQGSGVLVGDQEAFAEDILVLDVTTLPETDMFWYSHLGQAMKKLGFEEAVLHIKATERYDMAFELFIKKDGSFVTHNEFDDVPLGSDDYESGNGVFSTIADSRFFRYFCKQNPVIAGNSYQHPELLPLCDDIENATHKTKSEES